MKDFWHNKYHYIHMILKAEILTEKQSAEEQPKRTTELSKCQLATAAEGYHQLSAELPLFNINTHRKHVI